MNLDNLSQMIQVLEDNKNNQWIAFNPNENALYAKKKSAGIVRAFNTIFRKPCYTSIKAAVIADKIAEALEAKYKELPAGISQKDAELINNSKKLLQLLSEKISKKNKNLETQINRITQIQTSLLQNLVKSANEKTKHFNALIIKQNAKIVEYPAEKAFGDLRSTLENYHSVQEQFADIPDFGYADPRDAQDAVPMKTLDTLLNELNKAHEEKKNFLKDRYDALFTNNVLYERTNPQHIQTQNYQKLIDMEQAAFTEDERAVLVTLYPNDQGVLSVYKKYLINHNKERLFDLEKKTSHCFRDEDLHALCNMKWKSEISDDLMQKSLSLGVFRAQFHKIQEQMQGCPETAELIAKLEAKIALYHELLDKMTELAKALQQLPPEMATVNKLIQECKELYLPIKPLASAVNHS